VSLHHTIADGHTFYKVYGMLGTTATIEALDPKRDPQSMNTTMLSSIFGDEKVAGFNSPSNVVGSLLRPLLLAPFRSGISYEIGLLDPNWVTEQKKAAQQTTVQDGVPFVSTNDVVTSWFLRTFGFSTGMMAVNLRSRVKRLTDAHTGNYEYALHYFPEQFAAPAGIRKPLCANPGLRTSRSDYLSTAGKLFQKLGLVTNWSTFYQDVELPGCKHVFHLPVMKSPPSSGGGLVIFRATKEQLGLYVMINRSMNKAKLHTEAMVKIA